MIEIKSCGFIIFASSQYEQFLLMEHATRYDLPKGHMNEGESELGAAIRELAEETGVQLSDIEIDKGFRFQLTYYPRYKRFNYEKVSKTVVIFLAYLKQPKDIICTEHKGFQWIAWQPRHQLEPQTIDPLLNYLEHYLATIK